MKTRGDLLYAVKRHDPLWLEMPDGTSLAARLWLPHDAEDNPVPAIVEYIPYRRTDGTAIRDSIMHPYIAAHGYACIRVDLRGSGDSEGVLLDEYLQQELDDGMEVLRWIAAQPWCDGRIGIIGISWGGFNGLQLAAMRPPELRAVITVCSTDDRYADDVHHMGGCLLGDNLSWASTMFAYNSLPPDPAVVGERWREMWLNRLEHCTPWIEQWLRHQRRDSYWRHGSVCEDFSAIQVPVFAVSGWADGYSNAVFRLLQNLEVPRLGLIGPWSHLYPHLGVPGPAIGFLQEALRWWDRWLRDRDTGIMNEPMLRAWMQDSVPPTTSYDHRPGRWVGEPTWPSPGVEPQEYRLTHRHELEVSGTPKSGGSEVSDELSVRSPLTVGLFAGKWCSYAAGPDLAHDQRQEDGGALVFDSPPLEEGLEILGAPQLELEIAVDRPQATIAVRLSDIGLDDKVTRVTYGLLNLTHRESFGHPSALEPGRFYRVCLHLNHIAQSLPAGHRLRVALSTSYWPLAWPAPTSVRLTVRPAASRLILPIRARRDAEDERITFAEPEGTPPLERTMLEPESHEWRVLRDLASDVSTLEVVSDGGRYRFEGNGLVVHRKALEWYTSRGDEFHSVRGETLWERGLGRDDWAIRTVTRTVLTSDAKQFHIDADIDAYEGTSRVFCRTFSISVPRDFV
jgi:uncharacterized protein